MVAMVSRAPITTTSETRPGVPWVKLSLRNALLLLTFVVMAYPFGVQRHTADTPAIPPHSYSDLPNFRTVHTYLYRGGAPTQNGLAQLKQMGVSTIIDFRRNNQNIALERIFCEQLGLKYISLPMGNFVPARNKQLQFTRVVQAASEDPAVGRIFIHCSHGSDRTGFMVAMWRVQHDGWTIAEAAVEAIRNGFVLHKFRKDDQSKPMFD